MGKGRGPYRRGQGGDRGDLRPLRGRDPEARSLPSIRPTSYNYPVDLFGKWRGSNYSFFTGFRSGFPDNTGQEHDAAFTRLDHLEGCVTETRFDVMRHRYTGQWHRTQSSVTLGEAFRLIETEEFLWPLV